MKQNNGNFSMEDIQRLAQSETGKQLMQLLDRSHGKTSEAVRNSMQSGDMEQAKLAIHAFLSDPQAQALLKKLEEQQYG